MPGPALRTLAVAGVLTVTGVVGGVTAIPAVAEPGDTDSSSQQSEGPGGHGSGDTGGTDGTDGTGGGSSAPSGQPDDPAGPVDDDSDDPDEDDSRSAPEPTRIQESDARTGSSGSRTEPPAQSPRPAPALRESPFSSSVSVPFFRLPAAGEIPMGGWPTPSTFYTTVTIPVPTLGDFLRALQIVPTPAPAPPGPAFRTQEEAPVADATTGTAGGGGAGTYSEPMVFRAPLVSVPRTGTIAGRTVRAEPGTPGATAGPGITQPGAAGVRTPAIRGSVPPTPGATAPSAAAAMSGQTTRVGAYPRGVTNPALGEIAAVALPGVAGLLFLTFSGGVIGYRQANSTRFVRTAGAERFLP